MKLVVALTLAALNFLEAWGHGEDKPGPNNGFIRMPGAYHTEVVLAGKNELHVYLLDVNWKNPSVKNSKLNLAYQGKKKTDASCKVVNDVYFLCSFSKEVDLTQKGRLILDSQREGMRGARVFYPLPLRWKTTADPHSSHH